MSPALCVSSLGVRLGSRDVLDSVSFELEAGEFVGLIGPNGVGKSTLLKAIMGFVARNGTITRKGEALEALSPKERARSFSYLPQEREVSWPITVQSLVALGRAPHRRGFAPLGDADWRIIESAIDIMDLDELRGRSAQELSGGERARALIARALAQDTPVLLADEPAAGLDPAHQISLMATFSQLAREGRTVLASLHELTLAGQWCDRLILLDGGCVVADGLPADVLTAENLAAVYRVRAHISTTEAGLAVVPTGLI
jgi:iron complex transport system ATP-binding protein